MGRQESTSVNVYEDDKSSIIRSTVHHHLPCSADAASKRQLVFSRLPTSCNKNKAEDLLGTGCGFNAARGAVFLANSIAAQ